MYLRWREHSRLSDTADRLACQDDWDLCGMGYLDSTTFLEAPADAGKTGTNLLLLLPRRRHRLGTEHSRTFALKMQQVRHAPTSRPKPRPRAPGLRQRDDVLLALCLSTLHDDQSLMFIHSLRKYLSQVYYVSDPVLDTEFIQRTKSKDPFPTMGQDKGQTRKVHQICCM